MREAQFLKQNKDRWRSYESEPVADPDELADRFIRLTDDLAYARTFYPGSKVVPYLNGLASRFHMDIYQNKRQKGNRLVEFWAFELPLAMARHRKALVYSFLFFMAFVAIGAISAKYDPDFVRLILGDGYVDMTLENIEKGDPFGVYKQEDPLAMFLMIALNNIFVACMAFVKGIFLGIGTVQDLFSNGIMLGSFQYFFVSKGLGWSSVLVIFCHGTLEISAIVIAGAAGFVLGGGILFPGTFDRMTSLKMAARDGIKMIMGLFPVFLAAAFLEGFITRHTEMPKWLSISILGVSLVFIIGYFVVYPLRLEKRISTGAGKPA
jgi:uncharacterized membrane protein SpoIIM required for sporulation